MEANDCCTIEGNLKIVESTLSKTVYQCAVCERRHIEFAVQPDNSGVTI